MRKFLISQVEKGHGRRNGFAIKTNITVPYVCTWVVISFFWSNRREGIEMYVVVHTSVIRACAHSLNERVHAFVDHAKKNLTRTNGEDARRCGTGERTHR